MKTSLVGEPFRRAAAALDPKSPRHIIELVDALLAHAREASASDVHLQPDADGLEVRWRIDGVLHPVALLPMAIAPNVVARLKVMADLLTYRTDVPQEGRVRTAPGGPEMRVATFPTLHGERGVVRLFGARRALLDLDDLGLPEDVLASLRRALMATSGMIAIAGPAGSGKTTTIYAILRALAAEGESRKSIVTLEDPIESALPGVAQSQVHPEAGFTLEAGLRAVLRQDPEVLAVGEIRDRATAEVAFQAALTGHLVVTTFHAGGTAAALGRLADMGIEPYLLRSGLLAVLAQRLLRVRCDCTRGEDPAPRGRPDCPNCNGAGYRGRRAIAEWLDPEAPAVASAILRREDVPTLARAAVESGMVALADRARQAVASGWTTRAEIARVLGSEQS